MPQGKLSRVAVHQMSETARMTLIRLDQDVQVIGSIRSEKYPTAAREQPPRAEVGRKGSFRPIRLFRGHLPEEAAPEEEDQDQDAKAIASLP